MERNVKRKCSACRRVVLLSVAFAVLVDSSRSFICGPRCKGK